MKRPDIPPIVMVFTLWFAGLGAAAQFAKVGVMLDHFALVYPEAGSGLGFLVSLLSLIGCVLGLVAGMIVAQAGYRKVLIGSLALGALLSLYQASLPSFELMLVSRFFEGLSHLGIVVAAPTLIAQLVTGKLQAAAMTLWGTFFGVAFALVAMLGVPLVNAAGLQTLMFVHAITMAALAVLLWWWLPTDIKAEYSASPLSLADVLKRHVTAFTSPFIGASALAWLFYTLTYVSLASILPGTVDDQYRIMVATVMPLAGIVCALTLGVWLLRRLTAVTVLVTGFALTLAAVLLMMAFPGNPVLSIVLFFATGLIQSGGFAAIPQLNAGAVERAYANGAMAQMGNLGNLLGTPVLLGLLAWGGYGWMMAVVALIYAGAIASQLGLARLRRRVR